MPIEIDCKLLAQNVQMPVYARPGDAGLDLRANSETSVPAKGGRALMSTGFAIRIPVGYAGFVLPRSGLAAKHGITVLNAPGLIDSGYRGEIKVILCNLDPEHDFKVETGMRVAQLVIMPVSNVAMKSVVELESSERGEGGFGSTGKS